MSEAALPSTLLHALLASRLPMNRTLARASTTLLTTSITMSLLSGCPSEATPMVPSAGIATLGGGTHDLARVRIETIATSEDGLDAPTDVAIQSDIPGNLWITNRNKDGITIVFDVDTSEGSSRDVTGAPGSTHFLVQPSAIAFGVEGRMATAHDTDERTQSSTDEDFMGPTLWTTDTNEFDGGHASHYDMMHNSPNAQGIAWERDNIYWVADGYHGSLTRYDFQMDHDAGGEDHSDGIIERHVEGALGYIDGVPGHLEIDHASSRLFACDPANHRVLWLDIATGERRGSLDDNYDFSEAYFMEGTDFDVFVDAANLTDVRMLEPSGIALGNGHVYVSDHGNTHLYAFDLSGNLVDWIDLSPMAPEGGLGGVAVDAAGRIYVTVMGANQLLRLSPAL